VSEHVVYGLRLSSALALPELDLTTESGPPDVTVALAPGPLAAEGRLVRGSERLECHVLDAGFRLRFPERADFELDARGTRLVAAPLPGTSDEMLRHLLLDAVLPLVVHLRGGEALHATAVKTPRGVVAFLGESGAGKSTLAASFIDAGCELVCDDCLALARAPDGAVLAVPGYEGLRLHDDTGMKRRIRRGGLLGAPAPLAALYALERGPLAVERLSPAEAFMALVAATYRLDPSDRARLEAQHRVLEAVVARVPVKRLRVPGDLAALDAVRAVVLADR
jgi:hypothetical protein